MKNIKTWKRKNTLCTILFFVIFCITTFFSCSGESPEILSVNWRIILKKEASGSITESLSLFCASRDADGIQDIETIYLISDTDEYYWKFDKENWSAAEIQNEIWIGSSEIAYPFSRVFKRGSYRVLIIDKAGERSEKNFQLQTVSTSDISIPVLSQNETGISFVSGFPQNSLLYKDRSGRVIKTLILKNQKESFETIYSGIEKNSVYSIQLFSWNESNFLGTYSNEIINAPALQ